MRRQRGKGGRSVWTAWETAVKAYALQRARQIFLRKTFADPGKEKGPVDFVGFLIERRQAIWFDVKTTTSAAGRWSFSNLKEHQAQQLEAAWLAGQVSGLLIGLGRVKEARAWWVSWADLRDAWWRWKDSPKRSAPASWTPDDCGTPVPFTADGLPDFLQVVGTA